MSPDEVTGTFLECSYLLVILKLSVGFHANDLQSLGFILVSGLDMGGRGKSYHGLSGDHTH